MKERAASAVHREKVRPRLQYNYKQLRLNFSTVIINELSRYLWIFPGTTHLDVSQFYLIKILIRKFARETQNFTHI